MTTTADPRLVEMLEQRAATARCLAGSLAGVAERVADPTYDTFRHLVRRSADDLERSAKVFDIALEGALRRVESGAASEGAASQVLVPTATDLSLVA